MKAQKKPPVQNAEAVCRDILAELKALSNPESVAGMACYGINPATALGVSIPSLRKIAARAGRSHELAGRLWASGIHEARILAGMVEVPTEVTEPQMEQWAADFNSWDLCDQCCNNLLRKLPWTREKALAWTQRDEEFVKRAGFVLMACLAVHDKKFGDDLFVSFLSVIVRESTDPRNYVRKAVNWALRQIGKRNRTLNRAAVARAREIQEIDSPAARWIAADAIRELTSEAVVKRLASRPHT